MPLDLFIHILVLNLVTALIITVLLVLKDRFTVRYQLQMAVAVNKAVMEEMFGDDDDVDDEEHLKNVPDLINPPS